MARQKTAQEAPKRKPGRPRSEAPLYSQKRVNVLLPDAVFADAAVLAQARGESVNAYIRGLVMADIVKNAGLIKKQRALTLDANAK